MPKPPAPDPDGPGALEEQETLERPPGPPTDRPAAGSSGPALRAGQTFGVYRLVRLLGRGAFGQVWEAESAEDQCRLALKVLSVADITPEMLQRFEREGRLAASLNHPHCVYVLSAARIEGAPTIAMELMRGGTLQDLLRESGPLPAPRAVDYALEILEGLEAAHAAGILHRDLKPSNCFLDEQGGAKIGDFGLSKTLELDAQLTTEGSFMGTPAYASPEQVRGTAVDARSDLYSLGATLYALLCGKPPYEGKDLGGVLSRILTEEPKPLGAQGAAVPKGLQAAVMRLLQKDPAKRYRDHAAVRAALVPYSSRGLTAVELPRRFLAFVIDAALLTLLDIPVAVLFFARHGSSMGSMLGLSLLLKFLYFFVSESLWGRTAGKALLGLRVTGAATPSPSLLQVLVRTVVFLALYDADKLVNLVRWSTAPENVPMAWLVTLQIMGALNRFLPLLTMRARNGYAGLHELASRTRVRVVRGREAVVVPASPAVALPAGAAPRAFGPYQETGRRWERPGEGLLLARDAVLRRPVWIHQFADDARARPRAELAPHAPGRLRWLQGGRSEPGGWDAYEAPAGISLVEWVRERGSLRWREMREVLLGMARALPGECPLALDRVWVDAAPGHARIADFPVVADAPPGAAEAMAAEDWPRFLHQATLFGLEGRVVPEADLRPGVTRAPFPEHARALLSRLCGEGRPVESPEVLAQELELLRRRPAGVTRRQRLFTLMVPVAAPLLAIAVGLAARSLLSLSPAWVEILQTETRIEALKKIEGTDAQSQERREAIRKLLAVSYEHAQSQRSLRDSLRYMPEKTRGILEAAAHDYPALTPAQVEDARQRAGLKDVSLRSGEHSRITVDMRDDNSPGEVGRNLLGAWTGIGIAAFALTPFFGSGLLLYLSGITLQRNDGRKADWLRRLLRALLAWAPLLLHLPRARQPLGPLDFALVGLAAAGTIYALVRPERGLPDLVAGTRLVPR